MSDYSLSVDVIGAKELSAALHSGQPVVIKALTNAVNKTTLAVEAKAKSLAPHKTGALINSIHTQPAVATGNNIVAKVGTSPNIPYARAQEYGTVGYTIHGRSKLGNRFDYIGNIPARFYMKQAMAAGKPIMTTNMQAALKTIINYYVSKITG